MFKNTIPNFTPQWKDILFQNNSMNIDTSPDSNKIL